MNSAITRHKLRKVELQPVVDAVGNRIPTWKAGLLTKVGRAMLTKVTLSAILVHMMMAVSLSAWAMQAIDKKRRAFLWRGSDSVRGGQCLVAWRKVCSPHELGGLGLPDLELFGYTLRARWEWTRRTDHSKTWVELPAPSEKHIQPMVQASMLVQVGDGSCTLFWTDRWLEGKAISDIAPSLIQTVSKKIKSKHLVSEALIGNAWVRDISGALTSAVLTEYLMLWDLVHAVQLNQSTSDKF